MDLSKQDNIPLVATNDCHFLRKEDAAVHDILLCIGMGKTLDEPDRMKFSSDLFYYRPPQEMIKLFDYVPEAAKNTVEIADKTALEIEFNHLYLPDYPVPDGKTAEDYLLELCREGLKKRYSVPGKDHLDRLKHGDFHNQQDGLRALLPYRLGLHKVREIQRSPVGPGRGSGAGSIVAYSLGITRHLVPLNTACFSKDSSTRTAAACLTLTSILPTPAGAA